MWRLQGAGSTFLEKCRVEGNLLRTSGLGFLVLMFVCACSSGLTQEEQASLAAKGYYQHLAAGECELFLQGKAGVDSLPAAYREQLLTACRQYHAQQQTDHRGIREIRVMNARSDSTLHYTNVFLVLCFGDSTSEEIVVPMVERRNRWVMK